MPIPGLKGDSGNLWISSATFYADYGVGERSWLPSVPCWSADQSNANADFIARRVAVKWLTTLSDRPNTTAHVRPSLQRIKAVPRRKDCYDGNPKQAFLLQTFCRAVVATTKRNYYVAIINSNFCIANLLPKYPLLLSVYCKRRRYDHKIKGFFISGYSLLLMWNTVFS